MRRLALTCMLSCAVLAAAFAGSASARVTVGISDQQASTFTNPLFAPLKLKVARYIAPYDVMKDPAQRALMETWLKAAKAAHQKTLLSFEHSRIHKHRQYKKAPSVKKYKRMITKVKRKYHRYINDVSPWNEVNVCQAKGRMEGQPAKICHSKTGAKLVAKYYKAARKVFRGHRIVGLDILDGSNPAGAVGYIRRFKHYAKPFPKYWGIHNYSDTNRGSTSRTKRLIKTIGHRKHAQIWLTETGGQLKLRGVEFGEAKAAKALKCMFYMTKKFKQIKRLYIYQFNGADSTNDFDAGLINPDSTPRIGYDIVKKRKKARCRP
ncbi:MAG TPA: hypothetical protein VFT50_05835 [Baekduia sp.]|nr:hypothetical protein [Baekduia sp.]